MAKFEKLLTIRKRVIGEVEHHMVEIGKFTRETNTKWIAFRRVAFEKSIHEFAYATNELEKILAYGKLSNYKDIQIVNQTVRAKYMSVQLKMNKLIEKGHTKGSILNVTSCINERVETVTPITNTKSTSAVSNQPQQSVDTCENMSPPTVGAVSKENEGGQGTPLSFLQQQNPTGLSDTVSIRVDKTTTRTIHLPNNCSPNDLHHSDGRMKTAAFSNELDSTLISVQMSINQQRHLHQHNQNQSLKALKLDRPPSNGWICSNRRIAQFSMVHRLHLSDAILISRQYKKYAHGHVNHILEPSLAIQRSTNQLCYISKRHYQKRAYIRHTFQMSCIQETLPYDGKIKIDCITNCVMNANSLKPNGSDNLCVNSLSHLKGTNPIESTAKPFTPNQDNETTTNGHKQLSAIIAVQLLTNQQLHLQRQNQQKGFVEMIAKGRTSIGNVNRHTRQLSRLPQTNQSDALQSCNTYDNQNCNNNTHTTEQMSKNQQQLHTSAIRVKINKDCLTTNSRLFYALWNKFSLNDPANIHISPKILENLWTVHMHWLLGIISLGSRLKLKKTRCLHLKSVKN